MIKKIILLFFICGFSKGVFTAATTINKGTPFDYDINLGREPALARIDSTNYLSAYVGPANCGNAVILTANTGSKSVTRGTIFTFDASAASGTGLAQIDSDDFLLVYTGPGSDGWSKVLTVNTGAGTVTTSFSFEFDASNGVSPAIARIDATNYLVAYTGPGSDGWAVMLRENPATKAITMGTPFEFDASNGVSPAIAQIDATNYLVVYGGPGSDGWAVILTVNTATRTITRGTPFEYDTNNGLVPAIIKVDAANYLVAYQGSGNAGTAVILTVNVAARTITRGAPFIFEAGSISANSLEQIDAADYLLTYTGPVNSGRSVILTVDTVAKTVTMGTMFKFDNTGYEPDVSGIDATNYLVAYRGSGNDGWSVILYLERQTAYYDSGVYESSVKDASQVVRWNKFNWNEALYNSTDIKFQVRSGNTNPITGNYIGPDSTSASYFTDPDGADGSGNNINAANSRYFQYKAYLNTLDSTLTPKLNSVTITYDTALTGGASTAPYIYKWEEIFE
ncbi:MAG: hypothetical protein PHX78_11965 [bacterium]|nr:hypothetical protein [bacterium]